MGRRWTAGVTHPDSEISGGVTTLGMRLGVLHAVHVAEVGRGRVLRATDEISSTITAPVMKGTRGCDSDVRFRGGEEDVYKVSVMASW